MTKGKISSTRGFNSLRPRPNRRHFADDIFECIFENENEWISPRISLKFVPIMFELTIFQLWFRLWLGADQATSHYLNQWWLVYWRIYASLGLNELTNDCTIPIVSTGTTGLYQPFCFNRKVATPYQWQPVRFLSRTPRHISSIASRVLPAIRGPLLLEMAIWIKTRRLFNGTMLNFGWHLFQ